jgi:hypothetical protein
MNGFVLFSWIEKLDIQDVFVLALLEKQEFVNIILGLIEREKTSSLWSDIKHALTLYSYV